MEKGEGEEEVLIGQMTLLLGSCQGWELLYTVVQIL